MAVSNKVTYITSIEYYKASNNLLSEKNVMQLT